jgi:hypothetical protein
MGLELSTMNKFNGFATRDFQAFAKYKEKKREYNSERKAVWNKLRALKTELNKFMPPNKFMLPAMKSKVSSFWPNPRNWWRVNGLWLGYSHHLPFSFHPHLEVWIENKSVWIRLIIPDRAKKFQRRLKNYMLENKVDVLTELRNFPIVKNTKFKMDSKIEMWASSPKKISKKDLEDFANVIEPGEDYLSIGYSFNCGDGRLKTRKFIRLAGKLLSSLYPLYKHSLKGPDKSTLADLVVKHQRAKKTHKRYQKIEEGKEHKLLMKYLGKHPEILERGLEFIQDEYYFDSGDHVDLLFRDTCRKFVVVEVEPKIEKRQIAGLLQAVKYKYMLAVQGRTNFRNVRAFLVAKRIHGSIKRLARRYGVTTKEIEL